MGRTVVVETSTRNSTQAAGLFIRDIRGSSLQRAPNGSSATRLLTLSGLNITETGHRLVQKRSSV